MSDKKVSEEIPSNELVEKTVVLDAENEEFINLQEINEAENNGPKI